MKVTDGNIVMDSAEEVKMQGAGNSSAAAGWGNKFNGVAGASIGKINGVAIASIGKVNGVE